MKFHFLFFVFVVIVIKSQTSLKQSLQNGDLIFQEACSGKMNSAIKDATSAIEGYNFTHVGMVFINEQNQIYVIEATHPKVKLTPIDDYLSPKDGKTCSPISVVGRLKPEYQKLIPEAIEESMTHLGKGYDDAFDHENDKYYCSELIYLAFKKANHGEEIFPSVNMTFKSKETGKFPKYWIKHFKKQGVSIPEGKPGTNPGDMSKAEVLEILYQF